MTKSQFMCYRKQGYTLKFVNYGEDIKARIVNYGDDATYKSGGHPYSSRMIKVKIVNYGEDVKLAAKSYCADFEAV